MPAGLATPPFEAATGSWLKSATVLASSYVVPPIMKMMTSCGLKTMSFVTNEMKKDPTFVTQRLPACLQGKGSLCLSIFPERGFREFAIGEEYVGYKHFLSPAFKNQNIRQRNSKLHTLRPFRAERPFASKDSVEKRSSCR